MKWDERNPLQKAKSFFQEKFSLGHLVEDAWGEGEARNRRLGVQVKDWAAKMEILRRKKKLGKEWIFMDELLSKEEEEIQWRMRGIARVVRGWGEFTNVRFRRVFLVDR